MTQFDSQTDAILEAIDRALGDERVCPRCRRPQGVIALQEKAKAEFDAYWEQAFHAFDMALEPGAAARFLAASGYVLSREVTDPEERLDPTLLKALITEAQWQAVSVPGPRQLDQGLLTQAVQRGFIPAEIVSRAMAKPKRVTSRHRRKQTREDKAILRQLEAEAAPAKDLPA